MDEILERALLFDFYGELLSERQKEVYQYYVFDNLSLGEIAAEVGMSRQGVHDLVKRGRLMLEEYEQKLHLVEKFMSIKEKVQQIDQLLDTYEEIRGQTVGTKAFAVQHADESEGEGVAVQHAGGLEVGRRESPEELLEQIRKISDLIIEEL